MTKIMFPKPRHEKVNRSVKGSKKPLQVNVVSHRPFPKAVSKTYSISKLKEVAWKWFSLWTRLRDCRVYNTLTFCSPCFTCGKVFHYSELQAGHFIPGRHNQYLFDPRQVHSQCRQCNIFLHGNGVEYYPKMVKLYGVEEVEKMKLEAKQSKRFTREELEGMIENWKKDLKEWGYES